MITKFSKNCMGTLDIEAQFPGMRKPQNFIVYPMKSADVAITIQSDTRIGRIRLTDGKVSMSKPHASGAYAHHLALEAEVIDRLDAATLLLLKAQLMTTASGRAGSNGLVFCDNSGALEAMK